jgi:hypothetical protein
MRFGFFENFHSQLKKVSRRPPVTALSLSHWIGDLFRNPFTFVLLVWGLLFLMLGATFACAQDLAPNARRTQLRSRVPKAPAHNFAEHKIESVEIFSAGGDLATWPPKVVAGASAQRRASVIQWRAEGVTA